MGTGTHGGVYGDAMVRIFVQHVALWGDEVPPGAHNGL